MITVEDVISMKSKANTPFGTQYRWLIRTIENDLISKSNGHQRIKQMLSDYDYTARLFIVHQFIHIGNQIGSELFSILDINSDKMFLDDKYAAELMNTSEL